MFLKTLSIFLVLLCFVSTSFAQQEPSEKIDIQKEIEKYLAKNPQLLAPQKQDNTNSPLKLLDLSLILLNDLSASSLTNDNFRNLHGGGHDPKHRLGFTAASEELVFSGIVDPYFRGDANIVYFIDEEGESQVELEEAYLTALALPSGLQARAGQFFNSFGRQNRQHPHSWNFADQPVVLTRMFGPDGLRGAGAEISYTIPSSFYNEILFSVQNAFGETATSFFNEAGESFASRNLGEANIRSMSDLLYLLRWSSAFDLSEEMTLVTGLSSLFGPNSSALDTSVSTGEVLQTRIQGLDIYLKWKALNAEQGFPFVSLQTEWLQRQYEAGSDSVQGLPEENLSDWGQYTQLVYGFQRGWTAGLRHEYARGEQGDGDSLRGWRSRISPALTYFPSEFSKIRLQYNYDRAEFLDERAHSVILQFEVSIGVHGAHKF